MYQSMQYESVALSSHKSLPSDHGISFPRLQAMLLFACGLVIATMALPGMAAAQTGGVFQVTNIISDGYVPATTMDPNFIDPWGVAGGNTLWIDTNVTGYSYITSVTGALGTFKAVVPPAVRATIALALTWQAISQAARAVASSTAFKKSQ